MIASGGRTLPQMPDSHGTSFHLVPLNVGSPTIVDTVDKDASQGQDLDIEPWPDLRRHVLRGTLQGRLAKVVAFGLARLEELP